MAGKKKLKAKSEKLKTMGFNSFRFFVLSFTFFLVCTVLFSGCSSIGSLFGRGRRSGRPEIDKTTITPAEKKKARLLKRINRKFEDPDAHFELGQLYQADGMWAKAEREYNRALSFDPAHRSTQAAMVRVLLDSGDRETAKVSADIYMNQVCSSAEQSLRLGLAFQRQQLDEYALACYRQALRLAPNSAKIHRQIGYYYLSKNNEEMAREYLSRSFQLNRNQPDVAGELGRLGVAVRIPRKTERSTKKLEKIVERSEKEAKP